MTTLPGLLLKPGHDLPSRIPLRVEAIGPRITAQEPGCGARVKGAGCRVQQAGCSKQGAGSGVQGTGAPVRIILSAEAESRLALFWRVREE